MLIIYLHQIITVDVGCATCTGKLTEIQKVINQFMDLKTDETTTTQQCPTSDDIQNCQNIFEGLTEELLHVRNASISVQNVSVEMGRTWQYRQSVFNQSYTTVEIVNKGVKQEMYLATIHYIRLIIHTNAIQN